MGHFWADTQAHQFWHMNYWASRVSTGPQFIYAGFWEMIRNQNRGGKHTKHRILADELWGFQSKGSHLKTNKKHKKTV